MHQLAERKPDQQQFERQQVHGERPGDAFAPRTPGLEDVYYLALASAGLADQAEAA